MASENETVADIIAEMRKRKDMPANAANSSPLCYSVNTLEAQAELLDEFTDRLDAAWNRERKLKPLTIPEWIDHEESIADIAAVLRRYVLPSLADRLEAAWKRERKSVGNSAAMREALIPWISLGEWLIQNAGKEALGQGISEIVSKLRARVDASRAALALPRRQCDVGSAKEQNVRYEKYCFTHRSMERCCQDCPIKDEPCCELAWAQMPYAQEGGAQ